MTRRVIYLLSLAWSSPLMWLMLHRLAGAFNSITVYTLPTARLLKNLNCTHEHPTLRADAVLSDCNAEFILDAN